MKILLWFWIHRRESNFRFHLHRFGPAKFYAYQNCFCVAAYDVKNIKCCTMLCWMFYSNVFSHIAEAFIAFLLTKAFRIFLNLFDEKLTSMFASCTYRWRIQLVDSIKVKKRNFLLIDNVGHKIVDCIKVI